MTNKESIDMLTSIRDYLCNGNPIWKTEPIRDAVNMAIDALRTTEPTISKMEQVDEPQIDNLATAIANEAYCKTCKHLLDEDCDCDVVFTGYEPKTEPQTERSE